MIGWRQLKRELSLEYFRKFNLFTGLDFFLSFSSSVSEDSDGEQDLVPFTPDLEDDVDVDSPKPHRPHTTSVRNLPLFPDSALASFSFSSFSLSFFPLSFSLLSENNGPGNELVLAAI